MGLNVLHLSRLYLRIRQSTTQHGRLRRAIRGGETIAAPIMVHCRPPNNPPNAIPSLHSFREPSQDYDATPFASHKTISCHVEGLAASVRRQGFQLTEGYRCFWREHQVHPACERQIALARPETLTS